MWNDVHDLLTRLDTMDRIRMTDHHVHNDDSRVALLTHALRTNTSVTSFELVSNYITSKSMVHVAQMLRYNTSIRSVRLMSMTVGICDGDSWYSVFATNTSLESLHLDVSWMTSECMERISQGINCNSSINDLRISASLEDPELDCMVDALRYNKTLLHLGISKNCCPRIPNMLHEVLMYNSSLLSLYLSDNFILADYDEQRSVEFIQMVAVHPRLTTLDLSFNSFNVEAIRALAACIRDHTSLANIGLQNSNLNDVMAQILLPALWHSTSCVYFNLSNNPMSAVCAIDVMMELDIHPENDQSSWIIAC